MNETCLKCDAVTVVKIVYSSGVVRTVGVSEGELLTATGDGYGLK